MKKPAQEAQPQANGLEILERMRQGIDYRFDISCRAAIFTCRPLSAFEVVKAASQVNHRLSQMPPEQRANVTESLLLAQEKLILATTSDFGANDSPLTGLLIERMSPDEIQHLWKQYVSGCEKVNPDLQEMPVEELRGLVEALKKKATRDSVLTVLSISELVGVCRLLCESFDTSPPASSSG